MSAYVLGFQEVDQMHVAVVDGKGAHLGELSRIEAPPCQLWGAGRRLAQFQALASGRTAHATPASFWACPMT